MATRFENKLPFGLRRKEFCDSSMRSARCEIEPDVGLCWACQKTAGKRLKLADCVLNRYVGIER